MNGLRRVVVTGMGAVSAAGLGAGAIWAAARDGVSGIRRVDIPRGESLRVRLAANVEGFDPEVLLHGDVPRTAERYSQFALVAVAEALAQSGLDPADVAGSATAAIIGTGVGGVGTLDDGLHAFYTGGRPEPMTVPRIMPSSAVSHVSIRHGIRGPTFAVTSACASATQSIGIGAQMIAHGLVERALVGGSEASLTAGSMRAWELLRVLAPREMRPFSLDRSGMVIGEGAAAFLLETEDAARARGATILAVLAGYGTTSDARDMIQPDIDGAAGAMRLALESARLPAAAVGYVNAHGTGTALNDRNEAAALRAVFGESLDRVPVSSSKPIFGHALGASGALELVVAIEALRHQVIPPQINQSVPDPDCALNLPVAAQPARFDVVLSNTFAFGGINAALVVSRTP